MDDFIVGLAYADRNLILYGGEILGKRIVIAIKTPLAKFIGSDLITYDLLKNSEGMWSKSFYEKHKIIEDERKTYNRGVYFDGTTEPSMRIVICNDKIESVVYGNDMSYDEYVAKEKEYLRSKEYKEKTRLFNKFKRQDKRALRYRKRLGVD